MHDFASSIEWRQLHMPCVTCSSTRDGDAQVTAVRASPDGQALALQRTPAFLEVVDTGSGRMLVASPARRGAPLLGFFWTAAPGADLVMATAAGLELYTLAPGGQARRLLPFQRAAREGDNIWAAPHHVTVSIHIFELQPEVKVCHLMMLLQALMSSF